MGLLNDRALKLAPALRTMFSIPVVTMASLGGIVMRFVPSPFNGRVNRVLLEPSMDEQYDLRDDPGKLDQSDQ